MHSELVALHVPRRGECTVDGSTTSSMIRIVDVVPRANGGTSVVTAAGIWRVDQTANPVLARKWAATIRRVSRLEINLASGVAVVYGTGASELPSLSELHPTATPTARVTMAAVIRSDAMGRDANVRRVQLSGRTLRARRSPQSADGRALPRPGRSRRGTGRPRRPIGRSPRRAGRGCSPRALRGRVGSDP